jgi:hypothetical protein
MKYFRVFVAMVGLVGLSSCGGSSVVEEVSSTVSSIAVTVPDCSNSAAESAAGEPVSSFGCVEDWATLMTEAVAGSCTECESVLLYQWSDAKWELRANCNQYSPIVGESSCGAVEGLASDMKSVEKWVSFPSAKILCELWDANTWTEYTAETGCVAKQ